MCRILTLTRSRFRRHARDIIQIDRANFPGQPWSRAQFEADYDQKWNLSRVCVSDRPARKKVVGYVVAQRYGGRFVHINRIAVRRDSRGVGVGQRLVGSVLRTARALGVSYMTLEVDARALRWRKRYERACQFYVGLNFIQLSNPQLAAYLRRRNKLHLLRDYVGGKNRRAVFHLGI